MVQDKLISKKKPFFEISEQLEAYLKQYRRWIHLSLTYQDLTRFAGSTVIYDKNQQDSLWIQVYYSEYERVEIENNLKLVYNMLHSDGRKFNLQYFNVDSIDYCTFGNSHPFRIKIRNTLNDNYTYFYIKQTDSSRVFGLEFEHMLSAYNLNYMVNHHMLIEEHITGIPGDVFIEEYLSLCNESEKAQIAKEYVKFNERCMIRLLGDMRAYNFVIIPTHDFDHVVYKIRAIDFDQQSYEGKFMVYRPQFFKENIRLIDLVRLKLTKDSIFQYKVEERSIVARRITSSKLRLNKILDVMKNSTVSTNENVNRLKTGIYSYTNESSFNECNSMGDVMKATFNYIKANYS